MRLHKACLAVSLILAGPLAEAASTRIIGGEDSAAGTWPWIVSIETKGAVTPYWGHFCGGTLIAPQWVLTAAHCLVDETASSLVVRVGGYDLSSTSTAGTLGNPDQILVHPRYDGNSMDNDIALLHLSSAINSDAVSLISSAAMSTIVDDTLLTTMGWGNTSTTGDSYPTRLQEVEVPLVNQDICAQAYESNGTVVTDNMLCAGYIETGGKDSCQGDSGGPIVLGSDSSASQVGIVSFGEGCAEPGYPGIYTRLSNYHPWLNQHQQQLSMDTRVEMNWLPVGYAADATVAVTNRGSTAATITSVGIEDADVAVDASACLQAPLAAGASCDIALTVEGSSAGDKLDYLTLHSSGELTTLETRVAATILAPSTLTTPVSPTTQAMYNGGSSPWSDGNLSNSILPMVAGKGATGSTSVLQTIVDGPATVSFQWRVNNGDSYMGLYAFVDDTAKAKARNNVYDSTSLTIPSGQHLVTWYFAKPSYSLAIGEAQVANISVVASDGGSDDGSSGGGDTDSSSSGGGAAGAGLLALLAFGLAGRRRR
ncbi:serine protease [Pseudaeromonas sharmana]|uniref:Serine protease n=1 Tax=Pseudaeromonas sharmana TaxID=328412 RepID=A0ABV8CRA1_9GAMM